MIWSRTCLCAAFLSLLPSVSLAGNVAAQKWQPWLELGGFASTDQSRGEVGLWAPLWQSERSLLFVDLRGKLFEEDQSEGNYSFGYRQMLPNGWNFGFWGAYDSRHTVFGNHFSQAATGLELLSEDLDLRFNGYIPLDKDELISRASISSTTGATQSPFVELRSNRLLLIQSGLTSTTTTQIETRELALWGVDGELGIKLPAPSMKPGSQLRAYLGAFYFDHQDIDPLVGPSLRLEWRIEDIVPNWSGSRLTFETEYKWDHERDHQGEIGLRLRLPLADSDSALTSIQLTSQERLMTEALVRDTDIVTIKNSSRSTFTNVSGSSETVEPVEDALTGVSIDNVEIVANGDDLQAGVTAAGANSLIIASGGAAEFGRIELSENQTLLGGGGTLAVRGQASGVVSGFTAPGTRPLINHTPFTEAVVTAANNTHITGVDITGGGIGSFSFPVENTGVSVPLGTDTVYITNAHISRPHVHGVFVFSNSTNINVIDSYVSSDDGNGISGHDNISINVLRTTIGGINGGSFAFNNNNDISINDVVFEGIRNGGVFVVQSDSVASRVSGTGNVNNAISVGLPPCRGDFNGFSGSLSFRNGDVWRDNIAPCN